MADSKAGKILDNIGETIVTHKKPIVIIGGTIIAVVATVIVLKSLKKGTDGIFSFGSKQTGASDFSEQAVDGSKTTITQNQAKNYAEQLFNAMKLRGLTTGTDKAIIRQIFTKLNSDDFKMVYNAFGRRSYDGNGSPSYIYGWLGIYDDLDLVEWLNKELDVLDRISSSPDSTYNLVKAKVTAAGFAM